MAEAFVRTFKRDYVAMNPKPDALTVIRSLPGWFEHYNDLHPHRALGYRSPREIIAQLNAALVRAVNTPEMKEAVNKQAMELQFVMGRFRTSPPEHRVMMKILMTMKAGKLMMARMKKVCF